MGTDTPFIGLDTETTGLGSGAQAVEVGVCTFWKNRVVQAHSFLVVPGIDIDEGAAAVHGLDAEVAERYAISRGLGLEVLHTLLLQGFPVVGHNVGYDIRCLLNTYGREEFEAYADTSIICTYREAKRRGYKYGKRKLGDIASSLGIGAGESHTALDDAMTSVRVLQGMMDVLDAPPQSKPMRVYLSGS